LTGPYREIREHIKTALELEKLLVDVDAIRVFQQSVIEAIGEADEATKQRIITKLKERGRLDCLRSAQGSDAPMVRTPP